MSWMLLATFIVLMVIGTPLFVALLAAGIGGFAWLGNLSQFRLVVQQFFDGMDAFTLMAIPFFIMAGTLMNRTGLTDRLLQLCRAVVGHLRGGLGHINIAASVAFAGVNGSASADSSALGSMLIPAMARDGYPRAYAAGLTAGSSLIGPIVPPSIFMILYGTMTGTSIGGLFVSGILPGLVLAAAFMVLNAYYARRNGYGAVRGAITLREIAGVIVYALPALFAPVIILGGIISGAVTPTESGALAVAYVVAVGSVVTRQLTLRGFAGALAETVRLTSVIFMIIGAASVIGWLLSRFQVPQQLADAIVSVSDDPVIVLLMLSGVTFLIGMFMEEIGALILLTPVLAPIASVAGIDPYHFGIVIVLNITIALITPPMGACVYIVAAVGQVPLVDLFRTIWPFVLTALVALLIIILVPPLTTFLPAVLGF